MNTPDHDETSSGDRQQPIGSREIGIAIAIILPAVVALAVLFFF